MRPAQKPAALLHTHKQTRHCSQISYTRYIVFIYISLISAGFLILSLFTMKTQWLHTFGCMWLHLITQSLYLHILHFACMFKVIFKQNCQFLYFWEGK